MLLCILQASCSRVPMITHVKCPQGSILTYLTFPLLHLRATAEADSCLLTKSQKSFENQKYLSWPRSFPSKGFIVYLDNRSK